MADGITMTRMFGATPEQVFAAWTIPRYFAEWFGTSDMPVDSVTMDLRVGGAWKATMHAPDGSTIHWAGEYTQVDPPLRLAFTMTDRPTDDARELVTIVISPVDDGAQMKLIQAATGFGEEQIAATVASYHLFFDDMEDVIASM